MKVIVQVIMTSDSGATEVVPVVAHVERDILQLETLGLTLAEAKRCWKVCNRRWSPGKWGNTSRSTRRVPGVGVDVCVRELLPS
jgi:hypothetical protein